MPYLLRQASIAGTIRTKGDDPDFSEIVAVIGTDLALCRFQLDELRDDHLSNLSNMR